MTYLQFALLLAGQLGGYGESPGFLYLGQSAVLLLARVLLAVQLSADSFNTCLERGRGVVIFQWSWLTSPSAKAFNL